MSQTIKAIYHNGVFVPQVPCDLPENTEVNVIYENNEIGEEQGFITDPVERAKMLKKIVESMSKNTFSGNPPKFTRDELHERR